MKQEQNCHTIGPCYEPGEDQEEEMWKGNRKTDKTQEVIMEMETEGNEMEEVENNNNKLK